MTPVHALLWGPASGPNDSKVMHPSKYSHLSNVSRTTHQHLQTVPELSVPETMSTGCYLPLQWRQLDLEMQFCGIQPSPLSVSSDQQSPLNAFQWPSRTEALVSPNTFQPLSESSAFRPFDQHNGVQHSQNAAFCVSQPVCAQQHALDLHHAIPPMFAFTSPYMPPPLQWPQSASCMEALWHSQSLRFSGSPQSPSQSLEAPSGHCQLSWSEGFVASDHETQHALTHINLQSALKANEIQGRSTKKHARVAKRVRMKRKLRSTSPMDERILADETPTSDTPVIELLENEVPPNSTPTDLSSGSVTPTYESPTGITSAKAKTAKDKSTGLPTPQASSDDSETSLYAARPNRGKMCSKCGSHHSKDKQRKWQKSAKGSLLCRPCYDEQRFPSLQTKEEPSIFVPGYRIILPKVEL